jgi:hypothetical protein
MSMPMTPQPRRDQCKKPHSVEKDGRAGRGGVRESGRAEREGELFTPQQRQHSVSA